MALKLSQCVIMICLLSALFQEDKYITMMNMQD